MHINRGTDYEIAEEPKHRRQHSLFQLIEENIYKDPTQCPWHNPILITDWVAPAPIFTQTKIA